MLTILNLWNLSIKKVMNVPKILTIPYLCSMENRKIRNASPVRTDDITFKSLLEKSIYRKLVERGFDPSYEGKTYTIWKGRLPATRFYTIRKDRKTGSRHNHLCMSKLLEVTYTPDFVFTYQGIEVIIEAKGFENDVFPLKRKMFRGLLDELDHPCVYAEIFTVKQLNEFLDTLTRETDQITEEWQQR